MTSLEQQEDVAELLTHYDMWNPEHEKVKWDVFDYARKNCPVAHTDADGGGQWVVTRFEDVRTVLEDAETFASAGVAPRPTPLRLPPLDADPPLHPELRKLLAPIFSRTAALRYAPEFKDQAAALVDAFVDAGECDLVWDFAAPYVGGILTRLAFTNMDEDAIAGAIDVVAATGSESTPESFFQLAVLAAEAIEDRTNNPTDREDILNAIVNGKIDGRPLSEDEMLGVITVLFLGGLDTARSAIAGIAYRLTQDPELEQRLRDPGWVRQDMDEFIRLESPVGCLGRLVTKDTELGGVQLKAGSQLLIRYDSANHDPEKFVDADRLNFDVPRPGHAAFGLGVHRCLGAHLARIQIAVAFEELLKRVTNLRLAPDAELNWAPGIANGLESLKVTFDKYEG